MKSNESEPNTESATSSLVDKYLMDETEKPLVGRVVDGEASAYGTGAAAYDVNGDTATYQANSGVVSGDGVTAVNYGASDIAYGPADPIATPSDPNEADYSLPDGIIPITDLLPDVELLPNPNRVSKLDYFQKEENPEFVPVYFDEIPKGIELEIINEGDYGEWDLLPESYEPDPDMPMWR